MKNDQIRHEFNSGKGLSIRKRKHTSIPQLYAQPPQVYNIALACLSPLHSKLLSSSPHMCIPPSIYIPSVFIHFLPDSPNAILYPSTVPTKSKPPKLCTLVHTTFLPSIFPLPAIHTHTQFPISLPFGLTPETTLPHHDPHSDRSSRARNPYLTSDSLTLSPALYVPVRYACLHVALRE